MEISAEAQRARSITVQKARFLVAASALIVLAHAVDVLQARGPNWPALGLRLVWAALLLGNAAALARAPRATYLRTSALASLGTAALYLALLAATGWSRSPLFSVTFVLVIVLPVLGAEILPAALASAGILVVGAGAMLARDGVPLGEQVGWGHAGAVAFAVAWLLAASDRRARREVAALGAAREEALTRLAESERLAAVGRLASEVAHHVNNPLAAARSNAAFLRGGAAEPAEAGPAWDDLLASLDRIGALTRQLQREGAPEGRS